VTSAYKRLIPFTLAGLFLATLSAALTASIVFADTAPRLALALWPGNGEARTLLADATLAPLFAAEFGNQPIDPAPGARAAAAGRKGLREQPLNPEAVRVIAFGGRYSDRQRYAILETGDRLSRRDTFTQVWLIRHAALTKNLTEVMSHYDALLRQDSAARDAAAQLLARAIDDPQIADATARLLRRKPDWGSVLYYYLLRQPDEWQAFIGLHQRLAGSGAIPVETSEQFAAHLADAGRFADAIGIAELTGAKPLARSSALSDTTFATRPPFPGTWSVVDPAAASLQPLAHGGALMDVAVAASGVVARRLIALQPGRYRAVVKYHSSQPASSQGLQARIACAEGTSDDAGLPTLTVAAGCPYQWLSLYLPESATIEQESDIDSVRVLADG
jgi:hypothetical protein